MACAPEHAFVMSFIEQRHCTRGFNTDKRVAPLWLYLHPEDQVDLTNALFPLDIYCTAKYGPTRFNSQLLHLIARDDTKVCASIGL